MSSLGDRRKINSQTHTHTHTHTHPSTTYLRDFLLRLASIKILTRYQITGKEILWSYTLAAPLEFYRVTLIMSVAPYPFLPYFPGVEYIFSAQTQLKRELCPLATHMHPSAYCFLRYPSPPTPREGNCSSNPPKSRT